MYEIDKIGRFISIMCSTKMNNLKVVSVIVPIRNEAAFIEMSLGAVLTQDYPQNLMEIIVIDGMSDDGTREIIQRIIDDQKSKSISENSDPCSSILRLDNPSKVVPTGLNIAIKYAKGDVIIRVDGHCVIAPKYIKNCVEMLQKTGADNVGGLQRAVSKNLLGNAIAIATSCPFGVGGARFHYSEKPGWVDTVYLGAYRREVFDRIGNFDEELVRNQDDEFNFRLIQNGGKIWLDPSVRSVYYCRSSLRGLWKQYFQYGFYKVRVIQKHGKIPSWRHLVPAVFVLSLFLTIFMALFTFKPLWGIVLIGPYTCANLIACLWVGRRNLRVLPVLPVAFLILHLSYGLGFLWGIWYWWRRRVG